MPRVASLTADELLHLNLPNKRTELVHGQLVVREPPGFQHGAVAGEVFAAIYNYVRHRELGLLLDWLNAGTKLVWLVDPRKRTARVHRADGSEMSFDANGVLDGEDVLPGFMLPLSAIFR